jgi:hypothetical protein
MGRLQEIARYGWAGQESDDAHGHYAIAKHYSCFTYTDYIKLPTCCVFVHVTNDW